MRNQQHQEGQTRYTVPMITSRLPQHPRPAHPTRQHRIPWNTQAALPPTHITLTRRRCRFGNDDSPVVVVTMLVAGESGRLTFERGDVAGRRIATRAGILGEAAGEFEGFGNSGVLSTVGFVGHTTTLR